MIPNSMMKTISFSKITKNILALTLMGYFSVFSPALALAEVSQPVSAPITIPVTIYPQNTQTLDLEGAYMFKVEPVAGASGYLFGLFQDGKMIYENYRDSKTLSSNGEFSLPENNPFHAKFHAGTMKVMIRAYVNNQWSDAREITITLKPRPSTPIPTSTPKPTATPRPTASPSATPAPVIVKPTIYSIWPINLKLGGFFIISGNNFGRSGKVNFYKPGSTAASGSAANSYWSNTMIIGKVPSNIRPNQQYGIQVRIAVGNTLQDSSLIYRYISR